MPLYNNEQNNIYAALEQAYREMNEENYRERRRREQREKRARGGGQPDEERIEIPDETPPSPPDAPPQRTKRYRTRHMRQGEGLGVKPLANRAQRNAGRQDRGQPDGGGKPMRG